MLPVGSRKPNDLGLFDALGNAFEWCQDPFPYYGGHVIRGGAFILTTLMVRSADRRSLEHRNNYVGFRVARTYR